MLKTKQFETRVYKNLNKQTAIAPISFFGPIVKYAILKQCDVEIEIHENYQKRSVRNRATVLGANGMLHLSVPLEKGKNNKTIKEVKIAYDEDWSRAHIMTIKSAYGNSPFFEYYFDSIETILSTKHKYLFDLCQNTLEFCSKVTQVDKAKTTENFRVSSEANIDIRSKKNNLSYDIPKYLQVFEDKFGYVQNLSILDAIFNLGPETSLILKNTKLEINER